MLFFLILVIVAFVVYQFYLIPQFVFLKNPNALIIARFHLLIVYFVVLMIYSHYQFDCIFPVLFLILLQIYLVCFQYSNFLIYNPQFL